MRTQPPAITIYHRTIDNVTGQEIDEYKLIGKRSNFHYGTLSGIDGGESEYVVEIDVWNNEPALYGGMFTADISSANNCTFKAWDNENLNSSYKIRNLVDNKSYVVARCVTRDFPDFKPICGNVSLAPDNLYGTVLADSGVLSGQHGGDHMKIQTKISVPPNTFPGFKSFVFEFSYEYV